MALLDILDCTMEDLIEPVASAVTGLRESACLRDQLAAAVLVASDGGSES